MNTKTRAASESIAFLVIVGIILVVLNLVAANFALGRFDFTRTHTYSLSNGSERLAASLTDRMEITAYFSENEQLGEQYVALERSVRDILEEYRAASDGHIVVRVIHPQTDAEKEAATRAGVTLAQQQVVRNDSVSVVEGYRGLVISYLGQTKAIPVIAGTDGLEYQITSRMREAVATATNRRIKIGILTGHEGPTQAEGLTNIKSALTTYELVDVNAAETIPNDIRALLIIGPETPITEPELRNIDNYVMRGHSLGVFGGGIKLNLEGGGMPSAAPVDSGLNRLLRPWGVEMRSDIVLDARCQRIPFPGPGGMQRVVQYPALPIVVFDDTAMAHPALYQIPQASLAFTSSLVRKTEPSGAHVRMFGKSSERSIRITGDTIDLSPEALQQAHVSGEGASGMLAVIEGRLPSAFAAGGQSTPSGEAPPSGPQATTRDVRIAVIGTSSVFRDEFLPPPDRVDPVQLAGILAVPLNIIDWLSNDSDLIAIRAKTVDDPTLDVPQDVELAHEAATTAAREGDETRMTSALAERTQAIEAMQKKRDLYRFLNWLGIPVLFAIFGIIRWRLRLAKKKSLAA